MTSVFKSAAPLLGTVVLAGTHAYAQDSLLVSRRYEQAADTATAQLQNVPYTFTWNDLKVGTDASMATEWNDNVNLANNNPQSDFILRPMTDLSLYWPVTDINILNVSVGIGYEEYLAHPDYNRAIVQPGSMISWEFRVKDDIKINLHEMFSYYEDPTVYGSVSGVARFGGFNNTAGVEGTWDLNDVVLTLGYDHFNFLPSTAAADYNGRMSDFFVFQAAARVRSAAQVGLEISAGPTEYNQPVLQDNVTYSAGPFAKWQVTELLSTELHGGYFLYDFDSLGTTPASTQTGYYVSLNLKHQFRENISYTLEAGRQTSYGIYSSLQQEWYGQCGVDWRVIQRLHASTMFRYETDTQPYYLQYSDNYDRMNIDFKLTYPFNAKLTGSLEYRYWLKNSDLLTYQDYEQNRVTLQLTYRF